MCGLELNRPCFEPCAVLTDLSFGFGPVLDLAEACHEGFGFELIGSIARGEAGHPVDLELCGQTCFDMAIGFEHADCVNRAGERSRPSMWCRIGCGQRAAFSGGLGCNL